MRAAVSTAWLAHRRRARYAVRPLERAAAWPAVAAAVALGGALGYTALHLLLVLSRALG